MGNRRWTREEDLYLEEAYGEKSVKTIAVSLDRSVGAVINRKARLKLGAFLEQGSYITFSQLLCAIYGQPLAANAYRSADSGLWATAPVHKKRSIITASG